MSRQSTDLQQLIDSVLDLKWHMDPVEATGAGLSQHDKRLGSYGADDVEQYLAALKSLAGALEEAPVESIDDEIDRTALLNDARVTIRRFEHERPHEHNPLFWLGHALDGLYLLTVSRNRSSAQRETALVERIRAIPGFLARARKTLRPCPAVFVETTQEVLDAGITLVDQISREHETGGEESFLVASTDATAALHDFGRHMETLKSDLQFAIGEDSFNFRLHYEHALQTTAAELWRYGHGLIDQVELELASIAGEIEPGTAWPDLVDRLRDDHPSADRVVSAYAAEMTRSRQFLEENHLLPVLDGELQVVETPAFLRPLIPFAAYQPPGAFSQDRTGLFYVTPPPSDVGPESVERALRDHCVHELACTAVHEGYPGHHLQYLNAQAQPRTVRKVIGTPVTIEGWALYCEEMMDEAGFYRTSEERLFQRLALLWRAVRVVADVGLHTRGMAFDEAVGLLTGRVYFDRVHAEAEVRRYCARPAYQLCYAVGLRELKRLRSRYSSVAGSDFTPRSFHTELLSYGALPVSLIRWGMGLDN
jgi:uncharacterized protein (DUF885 family)